MYGWQKGELGVWSGSWGVNSPVWMFSRPKWCNTEWDYGNNLVMPKISYTGWSQLGQYCGINSICK